MIVSEPLSMTSEAGFEFRFYRALLRRVGVDTEESALERDADVYQNCPRSAQILFTAADATWRTEAARTLNRNADDPALDESSEAKGQPDSLLRIAYEARQRAYAEWQRSRFGKLKS